MVQTATEKAAARQGAGVRYRAKHRESEHARARAWAVAHPERVAVIQERHKTKHPTAARDWKRAHREQISESSKEYYRRRGKHVMRMREYGLTQEVFEHMLVEQGNACAICRVTFGEAGGSRAETPNVDHDHATGRVRALLCINCNFLIGHCREDPALLAAASLYLRSKKEDI
jgi:hypothetical protein